MATDILFKRSGITDVPSQLRPGEPAYSWSAVAGGKLYIGYGAEDANGFATSTAAIGGKFFTDYLDHTPGTLTADSAILVDSNSKIDILNVDTITLDGSTISVANGSVTDLDLVLDPQGAGVINVSTARVTNLGAPTANTDATTKLYVDTEIDNAAITIGTDTITIGDTITDINGLTSLDVDNLTLNGNTLSAIGGINLDPSGNNAVSIASPVTIAAGANNINIFEVTDSVSAGLLEVKQNGDVVIGGVLTVEGTGTSTFAGDVSISGAITVSNNASINADFSANTLTVTGDTILNGDVDIGDATTDTLTIIAQIDSDIIPSANVTYDLGSSTNAWSEVHAANVHVYGTLHSDDLTASNVTISGNLVVEGTTTTVNTETINLADNIITLNSNLDSGTAPSQDAGIEINRGSSAIVSLVWNEAVDKWTIGTGTFVAATFEGDLTGNAGTATALETSRNIALTGDVTGNVNFDGTANVSIATTIQPNSVALGTDTTGDYVGNIGITASTGLSISGNSGENAQVTIAGVNATTTTKGVASFSADNFDVTSGAVTIITVDGGTF